VALNPVTEQIIGYYTLSATAIEVSGLAPDLARRLPRYPDLPAVLLGRLAVSSEYQGQGIGTLLLADAMKRAYRHSHEIAAMAVVVDAKNDRARALYEKHGFVPFADAPNRLYLPMATIANAIEESESPS
jgi:GNAT superfamily N-acetyltransferase